MVHSYSSRLSLGVTAATCSMCRICPRAESLSLILPLPFCLGVTVMMVRSPISASIRFWDSAMPMPMDTMMTMEQQPMSTPSRVSRVRDRRRLRFWMHILRISFRFILHHPPGYCCRILFPMAPADRPSRPSSRPKHGTVQSGLHSSGGASRSLLRR